MLYIVGGSDHGGRVITLLCEGPEGFDWKAARRGWDRRERADEKLPNSHRRWRFRIVEDWIEAHPDLEMVEWDWVEIV